MLISARGIRFNVLDRGAGDPVLFLHGIGGDATNWAPQLDALAATRRVLALDMRGFGRSDRTLGTMTLRDYADDVDAVLDSLNLEQVDVVGLSMGGMVAQTLALNSPARVRSMVIADSSACADEQMAANLTASGTAAVSFGMGAVAQGFMPVTFSASAVASDAPHVGRFAEGFSATDPIAFQIGLNAIAQLDLVDDLGEIKAPTLVVVGEEDALTPPEHSKVIADGIAGARLEVIGHAGHLANLDQPERFTELLTDFLSTAA